MTYFAENSMTEAELRRAVRKEWDDGHTLTRDLQELPEVPHLSTMYFLNGISKFSEDWDAGKRYQSQHPNTVPWKTEYECGMGAWLRLRKGLMENPPK